MDLVELADNRLLWLDDEIVFLDAVRDSLRGVADVVIATSSDEAIRLLESGDAFDVVVTDIVLPPDRTAGLSFVRAVKETYPSLPVIVVSAFSARYSAELTALGVDALLDKAEVNRATLADLIGSVRRRPKPVVPVGFIREPEVRRIVEEEVRRLVPEKERSLDLAAEGRFDLIKPLVGYKHDIERQLLRFPYDKNVFLMMKFRESNRELGDFIIETVARAGLQGVRADQSHWNITRNVYNPIAVLYCCKFGIALFDEAELGQTYSPNVAYELGMMHYQGKECLILRHDSLPALPFDLIKDLYQEYSKDLQVRRHVETWVRQVSSSATAG